MLVSEFIRICNKLGLDYYISYNMECFFWVEHHKHWRQRTGIIY